MQNKANCRKTEINVRGYETNGYENLCVSRLGENKAKQTQFKPEPMLRWARFCEIRATENGPNSYQKCLFANAWPEPDFRYFSKAWAFRLFSKQIATTIRQGRNFAVCGDLPALWFFKRRFRSVVSPTYRSAGCDILSNKYTYVIVITFSRVGSRSTEGPPSPRLRRTSCVARLRPSEAGWRRGESNPHFRDATAVCSRYTTSPTLSKLSTLRRQFGTLDQVQGCKSPSYKGLRTTTSRSKGFAQVAGASVLSCYRPDNRQPSIQL
jgi:hypothetical protein